MSTGLTLAQTRVIDPILTTVVRGYKNAEMVGMNLFPAVPVRVSGGQTIEFGKESFRRYNGRRAPGAATKRIRFGYEGKPFALENHRLEGQVAREQQRDAQAVPGIDLGSQAARRVMRAHALELEIQQAEIATDPTRYGADHKVALSGTSKWSNDASTPARAISDAKEQIRTQIGTDPNVLLLSAKAFKALKDHPAIIERIKYTGRDSVTPQLLAALFDLERVVVGRGIYAPAQGETMQDIWGNNAVLAYVPSGADGETYAPGAGGDPEEPSFAYTYVMEGHPVAETPYYDANTASWIYPAAYERVPVLAGMPAGFLFQTPA